MAPIMPNVYQRSHRRLVAAPTGDTEQAPDPRHARIVGTAHLVYARRALNEAIAVLERGSTVGVAHLVEAARGSVGRAAQLFSALPKPRR